jgi:hypothetical protein
MSECTWLSDHMPAVAQGRAEWTLEQARHLDNCQACQGEWELVQLTNRMGEGVLPAVGPATTAKAVFHRLKREKSVARARVWTIAGLAAAAAIFAAVWVGGNETPAGPTSPPGAVVAGLQITLPELENLQPAELDSVLRTMEEPVVGDAVVEDPGLADLDTDELQQVLDSWEG